MPATYLPSTLLTDKSELIREHSFTRWLSRDLLQAATDFCKNLGLYPIYAESSRDQLARYIFWRLPPGASIEVRSGRIKEKFEDFDRVNREKNWLLLTLHISETALYSAVWLSADHLPTAKEFLLAHGITTAETVSA